MATDKKVVVITGASSGIGQATAQLLSQQDFHVVLSARREDKLKEIVSGIEKTGKTASYQICDVSKCHHVERLANDVWKRFGRIDVWINNAGVMPLSLMKNIRVNEWEQMVDVNIKGVLYGIAAIIPKFEKQGFGHIVNMSSVAAHRLFKGGGVYCATKYAVRAVSDALRMELDPKKNIRITQIEPGAVTAELPLAIKDEEFMAENEFNVQRILDPENVARAVDYALSQSPHVNVDVVRVVPHEQGW